MTAAERSEVDSWTHSSSIRAGWAQRARIVLLVAERGRDVRDCGRDGVSKPTVITWKHQFAEGRGQRAGGPAESGPDEADQRDLDHAGDYGAATGLAEREQMVVADDGERSENQRLHGPHDVEEVGLQLSPNESLKFWTDSELEGQGP